MGDLLKKDLEEQTKHLEKQASTKSGVSMFDKEYRIEMHNGHSAAQSDELPKQKSNLFRNASMEKWSPSSVDKKRKDIEREILKQLTEGKRLSEENEDLPYTNPINQRGDTEVMD